jgi:hypothetical protein
MVVGLEDYCRDFLKENISSSNVLLFLEEAIQQNFANTIGEGSKNRLGGIDWVNRTDWVEYTGRWGQTEQFLNQHFCCFWIRFPRFSLRSNSARVLGHHLCRSHGLSR